MLSNRDTQVNEVNEMVGDRLLASCSVAGLESYDKSHLREKGLNLVQTTVCHHGESRPRCLKPLLCVYSKQGKQWPTCLCLA